MPWYALFGAVTLAFAPLALAQSSSDEPATTVTEEVDVEAEAPELPALSGLEGRLEIPAEEAPFSASTVAHPLLQDQGATTLSDALVNVAGVNVQTGNGPFDLFFLRGFDSISSTVMLVDGVPDPESTALRLYNVDKVEVFKGGGGFLYGGRSLAGAINLQRKAPLRENFASFGLQAGSHAFYEATVDVNHDFGEGKGLRFNAFANQADNYRDAESDAWGVNPTFSWRNETSRLFVSFERVEEERIPDAGVPLLDGLFGLDTEDLRDNRYGSSYDISDQTIDRFQISYDRTMRDGAELRAKLHYASLDWQSDGTLIAGAAYLPLFGFDQAFRTLTQLDDRQKFYGAQLEVRQTFETGSIDHELLAGAELARYKDDFDLAVGFLNPTSVIAPVVPDNEFVLPLPFFGQSGSTRSDVAAPYLIDRIKFSDAFQVLAGVRYDMVDVDGEGSASDRDAEQLSPFLGITVAPSETWSVYGQYTTSFEPPSSLTVGVLEPEEGEQVELGLNLALLGGKLKAHAAWYQLEKENIAIPTVTGVLRQTGDQRSRGVELELDGDLGNDWRLRLALARNDAELTEYTELDQATGALLNFTGNDAPYAPTLLGRLWLSKRFGSGFGFGVGGRYASEQYTGANNAFQLDSYFLFDAALFYRWEQLDFHVDLENLADEEYFTRAFTAGSVVPAAGFTVRGGLRYTL